MLMRIKGNTLPLLMELQTYSTTMEINVAVSQEAGNKQIYLKISLLHIYLKNSTPFNRDTFSTIFTASLFLSQKMETV